MADKETPLTWGTGGAEVQFDKPRYAGGPRIYELIEDSPKENTDPRTPTIWAWPEVVDFLRVAGQPVPGPWPPHQNQRPDPSEVGYEPTPTAVAEEAPETRRPAGPGTRRRGWSGQEGS
jgi:hypothetical protein